MQSLDFKIFSADMKLSFEKENFISAEFLLLCFYGYVKDTVFKIVRFVRVIGQDKIGTIPANKLVNAENITAAVPYGSRICIYAVVLNRLADSLRDLLFA